MPNVGVTVAYPVDWFTTMEAPLACVPYDTSPIVIAPDQTAPDAPVEALATSASYQDLLTQLTDPTRWEIQSQKDTRVSGLSAVVVEASWIGKAPYIAGTTRYFYLVDRGKAGSVLFVTQGLAGPDLEDDKSVVDLMASQSTIKR